MEQQRGVKVVEICQVEPPQGTPTSLPLTIFDLIWLRFHSVERLFFYEFPTTTTTTTTTTSFFDIILPNLKHSLSLTLQHFIPLAGNIIWPLDSPYPSINYVPGNAVSFTIAESNANFNHLCSNLCEAVERQPLIPPLNSSHEQASVLALQLTLFPNFGFCIGINTHHAAMDGKSSTFFIKAWAYTCSKLTQSSSSLSLPEHLTPFFDRSVISDPTGSRDLEVSKLLKQGGPNNRSLKVEESIETDESVKGLFELTSSRIQKLKQYAQSKLKTKVSTFSVTCAYVLACLVKAQQSKANRIVLIFGVDCRSRLDPPILSTYFGNCVQVQFVVIETINLSGNDGFINALEGIMEALNSVKDGVSSGVENKFLVMPNFKEDKICSTKIPVMPNFEEDKICSISSSPRFEVYGADFGWGKPKLVDIPSVDNTGSFFLSESRNNNTEIEFGLALNKRDMEVFADHFVHTLESFGSFETIE